VQPQDRDRQAQSWGIRPSFWDTAGTYHTAPVQTVEAILETMGGVHGEPPAGLAHILRAGSAPAAVADAELCTEDGAIIDLAAGWPADLAPGYHTLRRKSDGETRPVIVSPDRCFLPDSLRAFGLAVQLHSLRSRRSWGMGDLADLRRLAAWAVRQGAAMLLLSPLHAPAPGVPQQASPYYPSSRQFRNPLYLRVEEVPGARRLGEVLEPLARAGRELNREHLIRRDPIFQLKMQALGVLYEAFGGDRRFTAYQEREGAALDRFATFCAISEEHGQHWPSWPAPLRHPDGAAVAAHRAAHATRVRFHAWLQWLLDLQLERAARAAPLLADLAVGVAPDGADAWIWQDVLAGGVRVGAPPDAFAPQGQDWGLPPFDPWKLRSAGYEPFIRTVRATFRHSGGIRVDHVMGLFRLYWIPPGAAATEGAYIRYPAEDLLAILALESQRAQAYVVGEDLGTVEPETREALFAHAVLSYRLLWFEDTFPPSYPRQALAAISTHDLPTVAGAWTGADLRLQRAAGLQPNETDQQRMTDRLRAVTGLPPEAPVQDVVVAAYAALAASPSQLVAATMEDALLVAERPNMPGTTTQWPNWSLALPKTLEQIKRDPQVARVMQALRR
jgi:4-alpha-glucanotransferase